MSQLRIKHSYDTLKFTIPMGPVLVPGETITGTPTFTITPTTGSPLTASGISILSDSQTIKVSLAGGLDGTTYTIKVRATITGDGTQSAEATVYLQINDAS